MISGSQVEDLKFHETIGKWGTLKHGYKAEAREHNLLTSARQPYKIHDTLTKGTLYLEVSETSSSSGVVIPATQLFVEDESQKTLTYQNFSFPPDYLTRTYFGKTLPPKWTTEEHYDRVFQQVVQLISLPEDWDSYGANPIKEDCISRTVEILKNLLKFRDRTAIRKPPPFIAPLSSGGIQIEWEKGERYLELDVLPESKQLEYLASDRTNAGELCLEGVIKSLRDLEELLTWFIRGEAEDLGHLSFEGIEDFTS